MFNKTIRRKLDFIIIGVQKGGTSSLESYLKKHPHIGTGKDIKELHFFDNEDLFKKGSIDYSKLELKIESGRDIMVIGEATPIYIYWESSIKRIWNYNPKIKLILILRNPIERAFSHWNMEFRRNLENEGFSDAIRNERIKSKESLPFQNRVRSYIDRGFYSEQLRRLFRFFDRDQLLILKYEDYLKDQENQLDMVFDFLGVESQLFDFEKITVNYREHVDKLNTIDKQFLSDIFLNDICEVERMLNWDCSDWKKI